MIANLPGRRVLCPASRKAVVYIMVNNNLTMFARKHFQNLPRALFILDKNSDQSDQRSQRKEPSNMRLNMMPITRSFNNSVVNFPYLRHRRRNFRNSPAVKCLLLKFGKF